MRNFVDEKVTGQAAMYALGTLSQLEAFMFEHGLNDGREDYADELAAFDSVVAALAFSAPERTPSELARKRLLMTIASEAETAELPVVPRSQLPPQDFHNIKMHEGKWDQVADGVFIKTLFIDPNRDAATSLVKLEPGARLPRHRHLGIEESIVLEGDCRVNGEILMPGDYRRATAGTTDSEVTTEHGTIFMLMTIRGVEILDA